MLLYCPIYDTIRTKHFDPILADKTEYPVLKFSVKIQYLLNNFIEDITKKVAIYLLQIVAVREQK